MCNVMQPRRILAALVATLISSMLVAAVPAATRPPVRYHVGPYPIGIAVGNGSAWVSTHRDSILHRIDVKTGQVTNKIDIGQNACGQVGLAFGRVWVPHCDTATSVVVVDASSNQVVGKVDAWPLKIAFGFGSAWMWNPAGVGSELERVDPATLQVVARVPLPATSGSPFTSPNGVWVVTDDGTVSRLDPSSNRVTRTIRYGPPGGAAGVWAAGSIYIQNVDARRIYRLNPTTGKSTTVRLGDFRGGFLAGSDADADIEVGKGLVWVHISDLQIVGINPKNGTVVRRIKTDASGSAYLAADNTSVWEPAAAIDTVFRYPLN